MAALKELVTARPFRSCRPRDAVPAGVSLAGGAAASSRPALTLEAVGGETPGGVGQPGPPGPGDVAARTPHCGQWDMPGASWGRLRPLCPRTQAAGGNHGARSLPCLPHPKGLAAAVAHAEPCPVPPSARGLPSRWVRGPVQAAPQAGGGVPEHPNSGVLGTPAQPPAWLGSGPLLGKILVNGERVSTATSQPPSSTRTRWLRGWLPDRTS